MSSRPAEAASRLRPIRALWGEGPAWRGAPAAALLAAAILFGWLWWALRERPLPGRRAGFPPPPEVEAQITAARDRLKADPQDIASLTELGTLLFEKGKESYVEAIGALEEARDLGAVDTRIFYCLGVMYQEEGLYPFALTEYKRFLRHYPEDREVRLRSAKLYYRLGFFTEAAAEYERLKFQDPEDSLVEENLGLSLWSAKQADRARASFESLLPRGGEFARRAEYYLAQMASEAGRAEEAAERLSRARGDGSDLPGLAPGVVAALHGQVLQKLGRWEEAKGAWEAVLKAAPGDAKAAAGLREADRRLARARKAAVKTGKK